MIKVTMELGLNPDNLYEVECERLYVDNYEYIMISKTGSVTKHKHYIDEIYKVEKQVKDLTIEEMNELWASYITDNHSYIMGIIIHSRNGKKYELNDYIDVTELIKEKY